MSQRLGATRARHLPSIPTSLCLSGFRPRLFVGVRQMSISDRIVNFPRQYPLEWFQERGDGSKNGAEIPPRSAICGLALSHSVRPTIRKLTGWLVGPNRRLGAGNRPGSPVYAGRGGGGETERARERERGRERGKERVLVRLNIVLQSWRFSPDTADSALCIYTTASPCLPRFSPEMAGCILPRLVDPARSSLCV